MKLGRFITTNGQLDSALRNGIVAKNFNFYNNSPCKCDEWRRYIQKSQQHRTVGIFRYLCLL